VASDAFALSRSARNPQLMLSPAPAGVEIDGLKSRAVVMVSD